MGSGMLRSLRIIRLRLCRRRLRGTTSLWVKCSELSTHAECSSSSPCSTFVRVPPSSSSSFPISNSYSYYRLLSDRRKLRNNGRRNDTPRNTQRLDPKLKPHLHHHPHPHLRSPHLPRPPSSQNSIHTHQTNRFWLFRHFLRYGVCCCSTAQH